MAVSRGQWVYTVPVPAAGTELRCDILPQTCIPALVAAGTRLGCGSSAGGASGVHTQQFGPGK